MYYVILILGGLLIMMGQHARSEALFYYFKLEEYIPENHVLRLIDKHISLAFVRERRQRKISNGWYASSVRHQILLLRQPPNRSHPTQELTASTSSSRI